MDYTIIARKGDDGKPIAGTFEVVKRDDSTTVGLSKICLQEAIRWWRI